MLTKIGFIVKGTGLSINKAKSLYLKVVREDLGTIEFQSLVSTIELVDEIYEFSIVEALEVNPVADLEKLKTLLDTYINNLQENNIPSNIIKTEYIDGIPFITEITTGV